VTHRICKWPALIATALLCWAGTLTAQAESEIERWFVAADTVHLRHDIERLSDVTIAPDGRIAVLEGSHRLVHVFDRSGEHRTTIDVGGGGLTHPVSTAFLGADQLVVADESQMRAVRFSIASGEAIGHVSLPLRPMGSIAPLGRSRFLAGGYGPAEARPSDAYAAHVIDLRDGSIEGLLPFAAEQQDRTLRPNLHTFVARIPGTDSEYVMASRIDNRIQRGSVANGSVTSARLPEGASFVDPFPVLEGLNARQRASPFDHITPIMRVIAARDVVGVTYVDGRGADSGIRHHLFTPTLQPIASEVRAPWLGGAGDGRLFMLRRTDDATWAVIFLRRRSE
jgi:hypothetical protein